MTDPVRPPVALRADRAVALTTHPLHPEWTVRRTMLDALSYVEGESA